MSKFLLVGGLLLGLACTPAVTKAQQPKAQWVPFQLDSQLAMQLPAPPRQLHDAEVTNQHMQSYMVQSPQAMWVIVRNVLPATGPLLDQNSSYARFANVTLAHWKAVELQRDQFHLGSLTGLTMNFRVSNPELGKPATGTLWVLRVNRTVYVMQCLVQAASPDMTIPKQQFLSSLALNQLPTKQPSASDFARFHVGQFHTLNSSLPPTTVIRTDTAQTETNAALGVRTVYGLKWNNTGYDMRQRSSNSKYAALLQPKVIHVRITAVQGDTYWYWATIDDFITTGQLQQIK
jgi:hypothetical protein